MTNADLNERAKIIQLKLLKIKDFQNFPRKEIEYFSNKVLAYLSVHQNYKRNFLLKHYYVHDKVF